MVFLLPLNCVEGILEGLVLILSHAKDGVSEAHSSQAWLMMFSSPVVSHVHPCTSQSPAISEFSSVLLPIFGNLVFVEVFLSSLDMFACCGSETSYDALGELCPVQAKLKVSVVIEITK